jgi:hypothetical protein
MRYLTLIFAILVVSAAIGTRAEAQNYPWCAYYGGGDMGGGENCGFTTIEQCMATVSGIGGMCQVNTQYVPPAGAPRQHARVRERAHKPS